MLAPTRCFPCSLRWPPSWGPRPALVDGNVSAVLRTVGNLWLDPWTQPEPASPASLNDPMLDQWLLGFRPEFQELFSRIKLIRNHMLTTLLVVDELASNLQIHPSEALSAMETNGLDLDPSWWSLVGHDQDLDELGLRAGTRLDQQILFRQEGWRVADALAGVRTDGAVPYDDALWLITLNEPLFRKSRQETEAPWWPGQDFSTFSPDELVVEVFLHQEVLAQCEQHGRLARVVFEHQARLSESIFKTFESIL